MKKYPFVWIAIISILIILGLAVTIGLQNNASVPAVSTPAPAPAAFTPLPSTAVLNAAESPKFGPYLVASNGMTLYTYDEDASGVSNCTGSCAAFWPPYTVSGSQMLAAGQNVSGTLGTIKRGAALQLTYNGMPLYFWVQDNKPGDVTGQGIQGFVVAKP